MGAVSLEQHLLLSRNQLFYNMHGKPFVAMTCLYKIVSNLAPFYILQLLPKKVNIMEYYDKLQPRLQSVMLFEEETRKMDTYRIGIKDNEQPMESCKMKVTVQLFPHSCLPPYTFNNVMLLYYAYGIHVRMRCAYAHAQCMRCAYIYAHMPRRANQPARAHLVSQARPHPLFYL